MKINLTPDQEQIITDELNSGHSRSVEEVIAKALVALREKELSCGSGDESGRQEDAVHEMLSFVEKNRTLLSGVSVKELIREGHRV